MPLSWKKMKSTRISQLVNDHLHKSQRRRDGSSLMVETGFPTSLVDLFIKNREKMKKTSKKKRQTPPFIEYPFISAPPTTPVHSPPRHPSPEQTPSEDVDEIVAVRSRNEDSSVHVDEKERYLDSNGLLLFVLKTLFMVVLALGTKKLTVGITISAFLLFFLDYIGKNLFGLFKPVSEAKGMLRSILLRLLRSKKTGCSSLENIESRCEIQILEPEIMDERLEEHHEIESKEVVIEKMKSSRRARIKSKMKKLVPKKLRSSRKDKKDGLYIEPDGDGDSELDGVSELSSVSTLGRLSDVADESTSKEGQEVEGGLTWKILLVCLIVLIGLIGGRTYAFLLTLSWFLLLKIPVVGSLIC